MIEPVARLKIPLADIRPAIGRRADMPLSASVPALQGGIQSTFRREAGRLFEVRSGGKVEGAATPGNAVFGRTASRARNLRLATAIERGIDRFDHVCDFGGAWCREVVMESVSRGDGGTGNPALVDAACRAPPEDRGGPSGFAGFTMADPAHAHHAGLRRRHGAVFDRRAPGRHRIEVEIASFRRGAPEDRPSRKGEA